MQGFKAAAAMALVTALTGAAGFSIHHARGRGTAGSPAGGRTVATVNGTAIGSDDLDLRLEELMPSASYHGRLEGERLLALRRAALDALVLDELIYQEARTEGRDAPASAVDAAWAEVVSRFESAGEFQAALDDQRVTERDLRSRLARGIVVAEARAARASTPVGEGEVARFYRENASRFQRPEAVRLLEILVRADPADAGSWPRAERRARAILRRVRGGADFGGLAREVSEDEYRVKDGDMGLVHRGRLDEEFERAVFAAPTNQPKLARSLFGYQVFVVLERHPPVQLSLDEARPLILEGLRRRRRDEATREWHERLLSGARVEIRDEALRAVRPAELPLQGLAEAGRPRGWGSHP